MNDLKFFSEKLIEFFFRIFTVEAWRNGSKFITPPKKLSIEKEQKKKSAFGSRGSDLIIFVPL